MSFDWGRFESSRITHREADVPVPELATFFADGVPAVWRIRGLTAREIAEANAAGERVKAITELVRKASGGDAREKADAALEMMGFESGTPSDLARRYVILGHGSVFPETTRRQALRLARYYPVTLYELTNRILGLTGEGPEIEGESSASGQTPECETPSHSAPEADSEGEATGSCSR